MLFRSNILKSNLLLSRKQAHQHLRPGATFLPLTFALIPNCSSLYQVPYYRREQGYYRIQGPQLQAPQDGLSSSLCQYATRTLPALFYRQ